VFIESILAKPAPAYLATTAPNPEVERKFEKIHQSFLETSKELEQLRARPTRSMNETSELLETSLFAKYDPLSSSSMLSSVSGLGGGSSSFLTALGAADHHHSSRKPQSATLSASKSFKDLIEMINKKFEEINDLKDKYCMLDDTLERTVGGASMASSASFLPSATAKTLEYSTNNNNNSNNNTICSSGGGGNGQVTGLNTSAGNLGNSSQTKLSYLNEDFYKSQHPLRSRAYSNYKLNESGAALSVAATADESGSKVEVDSRSRRAQNELLKSTGGLADPATSSSSSMLQPGKVKSKSSDHKCELIYSKFDQLIRNACDLSSMNARIMQDISITPSVST
jgi:hypothetical protein